MSRRRGPASSLALVFTGWIRHGALLGGLVGAAAGCEGTTSGSADAGSSASPDGGGAPDTGGPSATTYVGTLPATMSQFRIMRGRGDRKGAALSLDDLFTEIGAADAICMGEEHTDEYFHDAQLMLLDGLAKRAGSATVMALGMEMFQNKFQPPLDDFAAGTIDEATLLLRTQWQTRWGYSFTLYRSLVKRATDAHAMLRALNANQELTSKVGKQGLASLTPAEQAEVPMLDLTNAEHRAWFVKALGTSAPMNNPTLLDNMYAVQVIWDETMADRSWQWLQSQDPKPRQLAIAAGTGHCMDLAIPARLRRRGAHNVVSVRPVREDAALVQGVMDEGFSDYVIVFVP